MSKKTTLAVAVASTLLAGNALAAGKGERMVSSVPKVLHPFLGRPMISYGLRLANALKPAGIGLVPQGRGARPGLARGAAPGHDPWP